ncbi:hypothetical protein ACNQVK_17575 [Mycobacterium sp. 134]|uniref:hypothetical protein n=1 Tax=Mycobacterium sp. 134 TaxID=3400425 RepID=UPI003AAB2DE5
MPMSPLCARVAATPISRFDRPTTLFHVIAADKSAYDTDVLDTLVVAGGAVIGCTVTCPEVIETIHRNYFPAGAGAAVAKYVRLQSG